MHNKKLGIFRFPSFGNSLALCDRHHWSHDMCARQLGGQTIRVFTCPAPVEFS